ncbi:lanthionine synthetase LanC family protein [Chondromyces crocatus]|uniref:Protein kinase domain-containing protein n=1 Tax=Chondromyces crocatus TaxID=52 RepID=A0A0K1EHG8_CHOCO|nr:lanthionine synthetase LanC family protein [Chondromyces crocatus]AKT40112.1 uncharacterized protein CMC5_042650 [Chondromyces crocatus]
MNPESNASLRCLPGADGFFDIIQSACFSPRARASGRRPRAPAGPWDPWICVLGEEYPAPAQGWKLHLSATVGSAEEILRRALPILLAEDAVFKVASSTTTLAALNQGESGLGQVGKFITVYPRDDAHAVRLAARLDEATRGLPGPTIPSDRALRPGSRVFYRYGSFGGQALQLATGEIVAAMKTPDGQLVPDRRPADYDVPSWATDPFIAAGLAAELPRGASRHVIARRYVPAAVLQRTPRSTIFLALDLKAYRRCVLKRVERWDGARLRHEADVLRRLGPDPGFPALYDVFEDEEHLYLVLEDLSAETLSAHVAHAAASGCFLPAAQIVTLGRALARLLGKLHAEGLAHGDLKSSNVLVAPATLHLWLIDFELAHGPSLTAQPHHGHGTRGYRSPERIAGAPPSTSDDIHAFGALLYFLATGAEPAEGPTEAPLDGRPPRLMNPNLPPGLCTVIARSLAQDPSARYSSVRQIERALEDVLTDSATPLTVPAPPRHFGRASAHLPFPARREALELARRLGDSLVSAARPAPRGGGVFWPDMHPDARGLPSRDIGHGTAGVVLALSSLVATLGESSHRATLARAAFGLLHAPRPDGAPVAGLYLGEAGIGAALLGAGRVLGDRTLARAAEARGRWIATLPFGSPDLYNGVAGRLRFHLALHRATSSDEHLSAALRAGDHLVDVAECDEDGNVLWRFPEGHGNLSGTTQLGYAHGAAGIADSLLDLFEVTREVRYLDAARGAARWLATLAVPALGDGSGSAWPVVPGGPPHAAHWCHGATGIGRFFLHATALELAPGWTDLAARAARTVARGARWLGPTQCHGLAGNLEFLVDMFQATSHPHYLTEAADLFTLLRAFSQEKAGRLVWQGDQPEQALPALQVGYGGVATCLLRLGDPARAPHLLSVRGLGGAGE